MARGLGEPSLGVQEQPLGERHHRERRVGILRELRVTTRVGVAALVHGDARQHLVGDGGRNGHGQFGVRLRVVDAAGAQQRRGGAGQRGGVSRIARSTSLYAASASSG
jgi:hypothetical protein